jgi:hypothetical protein
MTRCDRLVDRASPASELASTALAVAPASSQGRPVAILIGKNFHSGGTATEASPASDLESSTRPARDCHVCGKFQSTVVAVITPHVTRPAVAAIGIRQRGDPPRQTLRSI